MIHSFWKGFSKQAGAAQVACVAVINGDKILLGKRLDNQKWTTPGGHMDPGETPVQGAIRELYEESGIKAKPEDLEHLATKTITKPDGKVLTVHGFKLDEGKHKTSVKNDPDEEVARWIWKPIPLPEEVANNLHVQKGNVLFDALKIDYPQEKKASILNGKSIYNAIMTGFKGMPAAAPQPAPEQAPEKQPHEATEHAEDSVPNEVKTATAIDSRLMRLKLRKTDTHAIGENFAKHLAARKTDQERHGDAV